MLSLFVLLYVLIIAIFKTIVFFICAISVFFDNMLNKIKSNQIKSPLKLSLIVLILALRVGDSTTCKGTGLARTSLKFQVKFLLKKLWQTYGKVFYLSIFLIFIRQFKNYKNNHSIVTANHKNNNITRIQIKVHEAGGGGAAKYEVDMGVRPALQQAGAFGESTGSKNEGSLGESMIFGIQWEKNTKICGVIGWEPEVHKKVGSLSGRPLLKDYRDHDFPNTEFSYFLTIDTRQ